MIDDSFESLLFQGDRSILGWTENRRSSQKKIKYVHPIGCPRNHVSSSELASRLDELFEWVSRQDCIISGCGK